MSILTKVKLAMSGVLLVVPLFVLQGGPAWPKPDPTPCNMTAGRETGGAQWVSTSCRRTDPPTSTPPRGSATGTTGGQGPAPTAPETMSAKDRICSGLGERGAEDKIEDICRTTLTPIPTAQPVSEEVVRAAALQLELPVVDPKVGPDPSLNRWNITPVNLPIWLWLDEPDALTKSVTQQGIEINMVARRTRVVFDMGNGDKVKCTRMSRWRKPLSDAELNRPSPNCGYRYRKLPKQKGAGFMMNVTVEWTVTWYALGQTGTIPLTTTGSRHMPVGELQSVIVPNRTPHPQPS